MVLSKKLALVISSAQFSNIFLELWLKIQTLDVYSFQIWHLQEPYFQLSGKKERKMIYWAVIHVIFLY